MDSQIVAWLGRSGTDPGSRADGTSLLEGDRYWNTASKLLRVYNGTDWQNQDTYDPHALPNLGIDWTVRPDFTTAIQAGDRSWNTGEDQYKVYDGSAWVPIGPEQIAVAIQNAEQTITTSGSNWTTIIFNSNFILNTGNYSFGSTNGQIVLPYVGWYQVTFFATPLIGSPTDTANLA